MTADGLAVGVALGKFNTFPFLLSPVHRSIRQSLDRALYTEMHHCLRRHKAGGQ